MDIVILALRGFKDPYIGTMPSHLNLESLVRQCQVPGFPMVPVALLAILSLLRKLEKGSDRALGPEFLDPPWKAHAEVR